MLDNTLVIRPEDVTGWDSSRQDKITLSYRTTDAVRHAAYLLIVDSTPPDCEDDDMDALAAWSDECLRMFEGSKITAKLKILPYCSRPLAGIEIAVITPDGRHLTRKIGGTMEAKDIEAVLDRFFSEGAAGLSATYSEYWSGTYAAYKGHKEHNAA